MPNKIADWPGKAKPRIVCAALYSNFGGRERIVVGPRHMDQTMRNSIAEFVDISAKDWFNTCEQGFIDQFGQYYNRTDAWKIAEAANQIFARCGGDAADGGTLYSENLY